MSADERTHAWKIAEQGYICHDLELRVEPHDDGFKMLVGLGIKTRWVFFDICGRVTHSKTPFDPKDLIPSSMSYR